PAAPGATLSAAGSMCRLEMLFPRREGSSSRRAGGAFRASWAETIVAADGGRDAGFSGFTLAPRGPRCRSLSFAWERPRFSPSLIVRLAGRVANGTGPSQQPTPAPEPVQEIILSRVGKGWTIHFYPDGRAHAQYGALPGDGASVPEGTVTFDALLTAVQ